MLTIAIDTFNKQTQTDGKGWIGRGGHFRHRRALHVTKFCEFYTYTWTLVIKEIRFESVYWIQLAQDRICWWAFVSMIINLHVLSS
jgi:hypothetical protein